MQKILCDYLESENSLSKKPQLPGHTIKLGFVKARLDGVLSNLVQWKVSQLLAGELELDEL